MLKVINGYNGIENNIHRHFCIGPEDNLTVIVSNGEVNLDSHRNEEEEQLVFYPKSQDNLMVYIDMDGVLSDFDTYNREKIDKNFDKLPPRVFWGKMGKMIKEGTFSFAEFPIYPYAKAFINWIDKSTVDFRILSSTGISNHKVIAEQKRAWLKEHFGVEVAMRAIFVDRSSKKARYATMNSILIDDRAKSLDPWEKAGGKGIQFDMNNISEAMFRLGLHTNQFANHWDNPIEARTKAILTTGEHKSSFAE